MTGPTRRTVMAGIGGAAALGAGGAALAAGSPRPVLIAGPEADGTAASRLARMCGAVLVRRAPGEDTLRFWQGRVTPLLADGAPVLGLTSWADSVMLQGLAREAGRRRAAGIARADEIARNTPESAGFAAFSDGVRALEPGRAIFGWIAA